MRARTAVYYAVTASRLGITMGVRHQHHGSCRISCGLPRLSDFLHEDDGSASLCRNLQQLHFHHVWISWRPASGLSPASHLAAVEWPTPSRDAAVDKKR